MTFDYMNKPGSERNKKDSQKNRQCPVFNLKIMEEYISDLWGD